MNDAMNEIHPLVYSTSSNQYYAYDPFSNRILTIDSLQYQGADKSSAIADIQKHLETCKIVQTGRFSSAKWIRSYADNCITKPNVLVLQISSRCNLACDYCIYSGNYSHMQEHRDEDMSLSTITHSIDFFSDYCSDEGKITISFYGGEALLCFEKIQYAVKYSREKLKARQLEFSISSNGTTLTPSVIQWLSENPDASVTVTVNGPFHDQYRKTINGYGSLNVILDKLNYAKLKYPEVWYNQIRFIANKVSDCDNKKLMDYYKEYIGVPPMLITKIRKDMGNQIITSIFHDHHNSESSESSNLREKYINENDPFVNIFYDPRMALIHERNIHENDDIAYISSCFPMSTRLFVHTDGSLNICERVSDALHMGNVKDGINQSLMKTLYKQLPQFVERNCLGCWAQRLCTFCFQDIIDENGNMIEAMPEGWCENSRKSIQENLVLYCEIAENRFEHLLKLDVE